MLLRLLWFAVFVVTSYSCPDSALIHPCKCGRTSWAFARMLIKITCEDVHMNQVQKALTHIEGRKTNVFVNLKRISSDDGVLPTSLLQKEGRLLQRVSIKHSNLTSLDEEVFADKPDILKYLALDHNALERVPTKSLQNLSNLMSLSLDFNRLEVLHADSFKGLYSLSMLSLRGNRIKFIDESAFNGMGDKLFSLSLDFNELAIFPSRPLRNFHSINHLSLHDNKIADLQPGEIAFMDGCKLDQLSIGKNRIRRLLPKTFVSQKELYKLDFRENKIESIHPQALQGIEDTLQTLSLAVNLLYEIPVLSLRSMRRLEFLYLEGNNISTIRKDDFLDYGKSLRVIHLEYNSLRCIDPMAFFPLDSVEYLFLMWNNLHAVPHKVYAPVLDKLKKIFIYGNPLHCDCETAWLREWMDGNGSKILDKLEEITCASPEQFVNLPLKKISKDRLVCQNPKLNSVDSCADINYSSKIGGSESEMHEKTKNAAPSSSVDSIGALILLVLQITITYSYVVV